MVVTTMDLNQRSINLKFVVKTVRMSAMVDALTIQRMRMSTIRLVNSNLVTTLLAHKQIFIQLLSISLKPLLVPTRFTRFSDLPN